MQGSLGSANANAWRWGFLRNLRREAAPLVSGGSGAVVKRTRASAKQLFDAQREKAPDKQGLMLLAMCSLLLAGYRELQAEGVERKASYEAVRRAFLATFRRSTTGFTRILLAVSRDPVASLTRRPYARVMQIIFGASMGFEERHSDDRLDLVVTRCGFNRFFVEHDEPLLTRIACEWDRGWIDAVNDSKRPIRIDRPLTISTGCERCEFQHVRPAGEREPAADVVLERRPEVTASLARSAD